MPHPDRSGRQRPNPDRRPAVKIRRSRGPRADKPRVGWETGRRGGSQRAKNAQPGAVGRAHTRGGGRQATGLDCPRPDLGGGQGHTVGRD